MTRAWVALGLEVAFFAVAFGWRSWVQWRRTGSTGFVRPRRGTPLADRAGAAGFVLALVLLVAAPFVALAGAGDLVVLDGSAWGVAGAVVGSAGVVLTVAAQLAMSDSWRIGVDRTERTELVTAGPFRSVRNPIFTAMVLATVGLVLLVPNAVALAALVVLVASLQVQVRLVEEPYLRRTHGEAYVGYCRRAGRFLPGVGTLGGS